MQKQKVAISVHHPPPVTIMPSTCETQGKAQIKQIKSREKNPNQCKNELSVPQYKGYHPNKKKENPFNKKTCKMCKECEKVRQKAQRVLSLLLNGQRGAKKKKQQDRAQRQRQRCFLFAMDGYAANRTQIRQKCGATQNKYNRSGT